MFDCVSKQVFQELLEAIHVRDERQVVFGDEFRAGRFDHLPTLRSHC